MKLRQWPRNRKLYGSYYSQRDVLVGRMLNIGSGHVVMSADLIPDSEFERTEFYNQSQLIALVLRSVAPLSSD